MHILIVEPDRKLAETYARAFELDGHQATVSATAQQGILAADAQTPDVVLLELQLAAHSGMEFLYELRSYAEWQHIPVVVCSQVPPVEFQESQNLLRQLGVRAYHYKPRTALRDLLAAISDIAHTNAGAG